MVNVRVSHPPPPPDYKQYINIRFFHLRPITENSNTYGTYTMICDRLYLVIFVIIVVRIGLCSLVQITVIDEQNARLINLYILFTHLFIKAKQKTKILMDILNSRVLLAWRPRNL